MSYLVLARKYRPRSFDALVGQEHVVQALANALTQGRLHHAYLFTGTRGVGKTTVSRILAKSLNCVGADGQGGITANPCGVCDPCREIDAGRFVDYIELDAASNRSVEEITPLLDQAVYKPVVGRFKVYLIDEVHMLSSHAFNAMLKTLEEPPEYLKFVLATTDPQKVPATVLSRCLQFNLRPMGARTVQDHLARVLAAEGIAAEAGALRLLSRAARGSMRDALSVTDQAIAFGGGALIESAVRDMLGAVDRSHAIRLIEALSERNGAALLAEADSLRALGLSAAGTLEELADLLQQMAVAQVVPDALDISEPDAAAAARLSSCLAADETQLLYSMALHGRGELSLAPDEYCALVMVLLRMLAFLPAGAESSSERAAAVARPHQAASVASRAARRDVPVPVQVSQPTLDQFAVGKTITPVTAAEAAPPPWVDLIEPESDPLMAAHDEPTVMTLPVSSAVSSTPLAAIHTTPLGDRWAAVVGEMASAGSIGAMVRELAQQSQCLSIDDQAGPVLWVLQVDRETLRSAAQCDKLEAALTQHLGSAVRLEVRGGPVTDTPALRNAAERNRRQREAEQIIHDDAAVRSLMAQYPGARIVPGSVKYQ